MKRNPFGGANKHSLYTPLSEYEQEVLHGLVKEGELFLEIVGWGFVHKFDQILCGDANIDLQFSVTFSAPKIHVPLRSLELILRMRSQPKLELIRKKFAFRPAKMVGEGASLFLGWTITIQKMSPSFVKDLKKGAFGLTTREGNRNLPTKENNLLNLLRNQEKKLEQQNIKDLKKAELQEKDDIKKGKILIQKVTG